MTQKSILTVGILIFNEVEVLDFCGPFEVFSVARLAGQHSDAQQLFQALTIAEADEIVTCRGGLLVKPHATIEQHPPLDILVVPGGQGTRKEMYNQRLVDWIKQQDQRTQLTTSVCTGAFLLAEGGLLNEHRATTHWGSISWMRDTYPDISILDDARVVDEGRIITSAGISAGIDMSLHVVERLHGRETAEWTARRMEYDWRS
ncbi:DJ-1/PfpI family protein [Dictyobacter aurantiacus]|uniref:AraC family transcriptional regulator n=1 Tax=Dictyobacter aurantiacus TaxID=1936993 RepID=A0A401ZIZ4_9CHLR|nr:DJ-1/PfpI family protein [Dictyobacter aurantiacus]GCE06812.1 AraC family transcriptional regulator [Dictyobacter aurantiacus]